MGGTIWVESEHGVGSSFHFTMLQLWAPPEAAPPSDGGRSRQTSTDSMAADRDLGLGPADTPPATPQVRRHCGLYDVYVTPSCCNLRAQRQGPVSIS